MSVGNYFCQYHWVKTVLLDKQMVILVKVELLKKMTVQNKHYVHRIDMFTDKNVPEGDFPVL